MNKKELIRAKKDFEFGFDKGQQEANSLWIKKIKEAQDKLKLSYEKNCKGIPPVMTYGELILETNKIIGQELLGDK